MFQETLIVGLVTGVGDLQFQPTGEGCWKRFTVETTRNYRDFTGQVKKERTLWRVHAWDKWAEWADKNVKTGMYLQVRGRLHSDESTGGPVVRFVQRLAKYTATFDLVARDLIPWGGIPSEMERVPFEGNEVEDAA